MELFRPKATPTWKKVLGNPVLHVALILGVILVAAYFIQQARHEELRARVELLKGPYLVDRQEKQPVQVSASSQAQAEIARENTPPSTTLPNPNASADVAAGAVAPSTTTTLPVAPEATKMAVTADRAAKPADAKGAINRSVVLYTEVDRTVLDTWTDEMRTNGQMQVFGDVIMGVLPAQTAQKIKGARGVKILQQMEHPIQGGSLNSEWFVGTHKTRDQENEMGFFSALSVSDTKDGLIKGDLEVQRAIRDPKDPSKNMERTSFGGPFEIPAGGAYIIRGLLPRKYLTHLPLDNNSDPFLSIFNSINFANGQTEFALILQFDAGGPNNR